MIHPGCPVCTSLWAHCLADTRPVLSLPGPKMANVTLPSSVPNNKLAIARLMSDLKELNNDAPDVRTIVVS